MGASKIMLIRHAEKPGIYNGVEYFGVDRTGNQSGIAGTAHLISTGWQRAGALVTLFAPPWGPKPSLSMPQFLFASNPQAAADEVEHTAGERPSERPFETLLALSEALNPAVPINTEFSKKDYDRMISSALACEGVVLIAWQHELIPLKTDKGKPGLSQSIIAQTGTPNDLLVPTQWPVEASGKARYDVVWIFDRPRGTGSIEAFSMTNQKLLAGDI